MRASSQIFITLFIAIVAGIWLTPAWPGGPARTTAAASKPAGLPVNLLGADFFADDVVYVIDCSEIAPGNIGTIKKSLARSIVDLNEKQRFYIVLSLDGKPVEMNSPFLKAATVANKRSALEFLSNLKFGKKAEPLPAILRAMSVAGNLDLRKKAIIFVSNQEYEDPKTLIKKIQMRNGRKIPVNTLFVGERYRTIKQTDEEGNKQEEKIDRAAALVEIAAKNYGQFCQAKEEKIENEIAKTAEDAKTIASLSEIFPLPSNADDVVLLIDATGSMMELMDAVKVKSIEFILNMHAQQNFHVIFFGPGKPVEMEPANLKLATNENKNKAKKFIKGIASEGSSKPIPSIIRAMEILAKSPRTKKAIYLITDGKLDDPDQLVLDIRKANTKKVTINVIVFDQGTLEEEKEKYVMTIAAENNGTYQHIRAD